MSLSILATPFYAIFYNCSTRNAKLLCGVSMVQKLIEWTKNSQLHGH